MIDSERNPTSSYRVEIEIGSDPLLYYVTTYPQRITVPTLGVAGHYRADVLPKWLIIAMTMLDMASENNVGSIPYFGTKSINTYWLMAKQVYAETSQP